MATATLAGTPPAMKVPYKRRDADHCKSKEILYNGVLVRDGKLRDVFVRLAGDITEAARAAPEPTTVLRQVDCMYQPRIQGAMLGTELNVQNADPTLHHLHLYRDRETRGVPSQTRGGPDVRVEIDEAGIYKATCDVHPWERAFLIVGTHPYFGVTGDNGEVTLKDVPAGEYEIEAWHSRYGWKKLPNVAIRGGEAARVNVAYSTDDPDPPENPDELKDLF